MANNPVTEIRQARPALDPGAPWSANAKKQRRHAGKERAVVYCLVVEGLDLIKIGRTAHLKSRIGQLQTVVGRQLHIGYWAEFHEVDAKAVERCALLRMRRHYESEGEWSLARPVDAAHAIRSAADFLGAMPAFEAGFPAAEEVDDRYACLRENSVAVKKRGNNSVDRRFWKDPFVVNSA